MKNRRNRWKKSERTSKDMSHECNGEKNPIHSNESVHENEPMRTIHWFKTLVCRLLWSTSTLLCKMVCPTCIYYTLLMYITAYCSLKGIEWIHILARSDSLKLKHLDGFVSYKHAAFHFTRGNNGLEMCGEQVM